MARHSGPAAEGTQARQHAQARVPTSYKCRKLKRKKIDGRMEDLTDKVSLLEYSCSVTGDGPKVGFV